MWYEFYSGNKGMIESISIDMSKLDKSLCDYLTSSIRDGVKIINNRIVIETYINPNVLEELNRGLFECIYKYTLDNVMNANLLEKNVNVEKSDDIVRKNDVTDEKNKAVNNEIKGVNEITSIQKNEPQLETPDAILKIVKDKKSISASNIALELNLTEVYAVNILNKLRRQGIITYNIVGNTRYYEIDQKV